MAEEQTQASDTAGTPPTVMPSAGYEFTPDQNREIAAVGSAFWLMGFVVGVQVVKQIYRAGISVWHLLDGDARASWVSVGERFALVLFLAPLAYWLLQASASFRNITETSGRDIDHLMDALRAIRSAYSWVIVLILAALALGLVLMIVVRWLR